MLQCGPSHCRWPAPVPQDDLKAWPQSPHIVSHLTPLNVQIVCCCIWGLESSPSVRSFLFSLAIGLCFGHTGSCVCLGVELSRVPLPILSSIPPPTLLPTLFLVYVIKCITEYSLFVCGL